MALLLLRMSLNKKFQYVKFREDRQDEVDGFLDRWSHHLLLQMENQEPRKSWRPLSAASLSSPAAISPVETPAPAVVGRPPTFHRAAGSQVPPLPCWPSPSARPRQYVRDGEEQAANHRRARPSAVDHHDAQAEGQRPQKAARAGRELGDKISAACVPSSPRVPLEPAQPPRVLSNEVGNNEN